MAEKTLTEFINNDSETVAQPYLHTDLSVKAPNIMTGADFQRQTTVSDDWKTKFYEPQDVNKVSEAVLSAGRAAVDEVRNMPYKFANWTAQTILETNTKETENKIKGFEKWKTMHPEQSAEIDKAIDKLKGQKYPLDDWARNIIAGATQIQQDRETMRQVEAAMNGIDQNAFTNKFATIIGQMLPIMATGSGVSKVALATGATRATATELGLTAMKAGTAIQMTGDYAAETAKEYLARTGDSDFSEFTAKDASGLMALGYGAVGTAIEYGFGGVEPLAVGALSKVGIKKGLVKAGAKIAAEEASEEFLQGFTEYLARSADNTNTRTFGQAMKDSVQGAAWGALVGGTLGTATYHTKRNELVRAFKGFGLAESEARDAADIMIEDTGQEIGNNFEANQSLKSGFGPTYSKVYTAIDEALKTAEVQGVQVVRPEERADYIQGVAMNFGVFASNQARLLKMNTADFLSNITPEYVNGQIRMYPEGYMSPSYAYERIGNLETRIKNIENGVDEMGQPVSQTEQDRYNEYKTQLKSLQKVHSARINREKKLVREQTAKAVKAIENVKATEKVASQTGENTIFFNETEVPVQYKIVDLNTLQTSHINGERNPNYPQNLQNRLRGEAKSTQWIEAQAKKFIPAKVMVGAGADQGSPVILKNGVVLAGNGRTEILRKADRKEYTDALRKAGYDITGVENPVLVREIQGNYTDAQLEQLVSQSQVSGTVELDRTETALDDAKTRIAAGNYTLESFFNALPDNQKSKYQNDITFNKAIQQRYNDALMAWIINDPKLFDEIVVQNATKTAKVINGISSIAPQFVQFNMEIAEPYQITNDTRLALANYILYYGQSDISDFYRSTDMFSQGGFDSNALLYAMRTTQSSAGISQYLQEYMNGAERAKQATFFGSQSKTDILAEITDGTFMQLKNDPQFISLFTQLPVNIVADEFIPTQKQTEIKTSNIQELYKPENVLFFMANTSNGITTLKLYSPKDSKISIQSNRPYIAESEIDFKALTASRKVSQILNNGEYDSIISGNNIFVADREQTSIISENQDPRKQAQLDIILRANPAEDEMHTWIRSIDDIKTFDEAIKDPESFAYPDYSLEDAKVALESSKITVYSSKPIKDGNFVTPSYMQAEEYAGNAKIYSKTVSIQDIAWINADEGQFAHVESNQIKSINNQDSWDVDNDNIYYDTTRGSFDIIRGAITLTGTVKANTIPHELGHFWLDNMWNRYKSGQFTQEWLGNFNTILTWLGQDPNADFISRPAHEQFARAYEAFISGRTVANVIGLKPAFDRYDKFVRRVYKTSREIKYKNADGKLVNPVFTQEVFNVFDQMLQVPDGFEIGEMTTEEPVAVDKQSRESRAKIVSESLKFQKDEIAKNQKERALADPADTVRTTGYAQDEKGKIKQGRNGFYIESTNEEQRRQALRLAKKDPKLAESIIYGGPNETNIDRGVIARVYANYIAKEDPNTAQMIREYDITNISRSAAKTLAHIPRNDMFRTAMRRLISQKERNIAQANYGLRRDMVEQLNESIETQVALAWEKVKAAPKELKANVAKLEIQNIVDGFSGVDIATELKDLDYNLNDQQIFTEKAIMQVRRKLGISITENESDTLQDLIDQIESAKTGDEWMDNNYLSIDKARLLRQYAEFQAGYVPINTFDKATRLWYPASMLFNIPTHLKNVVTNIFQQANSIIVNKIMNPKESLIPFDKIMSDCKYDINLYVKTGFMASMMTKLDSPQQILGEKRTVINDPSWIDRVAESSLNWLSVEDSVFKSLSFYRELASISSKQARNEGLTGTALEKRALELYNQGRSLQNQTDWGKETREQASEIAKIDTFVGSNGWTRFIKNIRNALNTIEYRKGKSLNLGQIASPFIVVGTNIVRGGFNLTGLPVASGIALDIIKPGMRINYGLVEQWIESDIISERQGKNLVSGGKINANVARVLMAETELTESDIAKLEVKDRLGARTMRGIVESGTAWLMVIGLLAALKDEDYMPDYDQATGREKQLAKEKGITFGSVRIFGTWYSLDLFGYMKYPVQWAFTARRNGVSTIPTSMIGTLTELPIAKDITNYYNQNKYNQDTTDWALGVGDFVLDKFNGMIPGVINNAKRIMIKEGVLPSIKLKRKEQIKTEQTRDMDVSDVVLYTLFGQSIAND